MLWSHLNPSDSMTFLPFFFTLTLTLTTSLVVADPVCLEVPGCGIPCSSDADCNTFADPNFACKVCYEGQCVGESYVLQKQKGLK